MSMTAILSTATDLKIAANDRTSKKVFYVAEAGLEDARSRLQTGASASHTQPSRHPGLEGLYRDGHGSRMEGIPEQQSAVAITR